MKSYLAFLYFILMIPALFGEAFVADFLSMDSDFVSTGLGRSKFAEGGSVSVFSNPASVYLDGPKYYVSHEALFGNLVSSDALGALIRLKNTSYLALGALYHGGGGIEVTELPDPTKPIGPNNRPFSVAENGHHDVALGAAYAVEFDRKLSVGASLGGMFRSLVDESAFGGFLSLGINWRALPKLNLGIVAGNLTLSSWSTGDFEFGSPEFTAGGVYSTDLGGQFTGRLTGEAGFSPSSRLFEFSAGAELTYASLVSIRAGTDSGNITAGADFALFPDIIVGAAMSTHSDLPLSYRLGINIYRGK